MLFSRRNLLLATGGAAALSAIGTMPRRVWAADKIKTAAIYTVPVEQQWVSRIHKAATTAQERGDIEYTFSEKVANTDYERVMREYCEAGHQLIVGEAFAVEDAARAVAKDYPDRAFLIGSSFKPDAAVPNFAVFDNYIQDASYLTGIVAGAMTKKKQHRHGRRLSDPGSEPADERLHGRREGNRARHQVPGRLHRLLVRSAEGQGDRLRPDRCRRRSACMPSASACPTRPRSGACWRSAT